MRILNLLKPSLIAASLMVAYAADAQVLTPGTLRAGPQIAGLATTGTTVGGATPGPLGHLTSGRFGLFEPEDNWAALGESPFGTPQNILPYGLRLQKQTQFALFNLIPNQPFNSPKIPQDLVIAWGENTDASIKFRWIKEQRSNTFVDVLKIDSKGTTTIAGDVTANQVLLTSDQRFKQGIAPLSNGLGLIRQMQGATYQFKQTEEFANRNFPTAKQYGFIAQDLLKVLPEAVIMQKDGYYAVNYMAVIPILVEAVKQLDAKQVQLDAKQTENAQLQTRLDALETQVKELRALVQASAGKPATVGATETDATPVRLAQNAPNPFSETTRIEYTLPTGTTGAVLTISDVQGRLVRTIADLSAEQRTVEVKAGSLPAGVYTYTLSVGGKKVASKQMVLTR